MPGFLALYRSSVKSDISDELVNTYVIRPLAGVVVWLLYPTRITPNQVTVASTVAGLVAAALYLGGNYGLTLTAGLCVTVKDLLDSADGQLARARQQYSRKGRFLDSIGDILVNAAVFAAISVALWRQGAGGSVFFGGAAAFLGITLRVSYHVFYQATFLHLERQYALNRVTEEIRPEDREGDPTTLTLQRIFQVLYGWQDRLMVRLDTWCRPRGEPDPQADRRWYGDPFGLRLSGFLGLGTELMLLTLCSVAGRLDLYLFLNLVLMNTLWVMAIVYRKWILRMRVTLPGGAA